MSKEIDWSKAPEGATHARDCGWDHPDWYKIVDGVLMVHSCNEVWDRSGYSDMSEVPNLQTRPAKEWTGQGLPPVGTVCEFYDESSSVYWREGLENGDKVKILAHYSPLGDGDMVAVFCYEIEGGKLTDQAVADCFRPIRTHEQIAAEEREKAVSDMLSMWMDCGSARDFCEYLHDHGYRKTEAGK